MHGINMALNEINTVEMPRNDAPYDIKIDNVLATLREKNTNLIEEKYFQEFKSLPFINGLKEDDFQIKYNPGTNKILFIKRETKWYIIRL